MTKPGEMVIYGYIKNNLRWFRGNEGDGAKALEPLTNVAVACALFSINRR